MRPLLTYVILLMSFSCKAQLSALPTWLGTGGTGSGNWTFIDSVSGSPLTDAASTVSTRRTINTTGANLYVVVIPDSRFTATPVGTVTSTTSNTFVPIATYTVSTSNIRMTAFYCANPTTGTAETFTYTASGAVYPCMFVYAYNGAALSPIDQSNGVVSSAAVTSIGTGGITPSQNGCLVFTACVGLFTVQPTISGGGFSNSDRLGWSGTVNNRQNGSGMAAIVQTTAASTNPTWSFTSSTILSMIFSFKSQ